MANALAHAIRTGYPTAVLIVNSLFKNSTWEKDIDGNWETNLVRKSDFLQYAMFRNTIPQRLVRFFAQQKSALYLVYVAYFVNYIVKKRASRGTSCARARASISRGFGRTGKPIIYVCLNSKSCTMRNSPGEIPWGSIRLGGNNVAAQDRHRKSVRGDRAGDPSSAKVTDITVQVNYIVSCTCNTGLLHKEKSLESGKESSRTSLRKISVYVCVREELKSRLVMVHTARSAQLLTRFNSSNKGLEISTLFLGRTFIATFEF